MRAVPNGEVHLDDILQEVAKETGGTMAQARLVHNAMWEVGILPRFEGVSADLVALKR